MFAFVGEIANITTWSAVEVNTGLFCASAPAIKPLLRRFKFNFLSSSTGGTAEGKVQSRHMRIGEVSNLKYSKGHIELNSRDIRRQCKSSSTNTTTVKIWGGNDNGDQTSTGDNESVQGILNSRSNTGILKVVSITVGENQGHCDKQQDVEGDTTIFEPV